MTGLLAVCVWRGNTYDTISVEDPSWEEVIEAISQLNNRERNDLYLHPESEDPEYFLGVCGGDGKYFVSGMDLNESARTWPSPKNAGTRLVKLVAGGSSRSLKSGSSWI